MRDLSSENKNAYKSYFLDTPGGGDHFQEMGVETEKAETNFTLCYLSERGWHLANFFDNGALK